MAESDCYQRVGKYLWRVGGGKGWKMIESRPGWQSHGEKGAGRVCRDWEAGVLELRTEREEMGWRLKEVPQIAP